jgi:hypothetical protein
VGDTKEDSERRTDHSLAKNGRGKRQNHESILENIVYKFKQNNMRNTGAVKTCKGETKGNSPYQG